MAQAADLVQDRAQRPNVVLRVVRLALAQLWREEVGRPKAGVGVGQGVGQHRGQAKVAKLDAPVGSQKNVLRLSTERGGVDGQWLW